MSEAHDNARRPLIQFSKYLVPIHLSTHFVIVSKLDLQFNGLLQTLKTPMEHGYLG